jgi:hypothetical protein
VIFASSMKTSAGSDSAKSAREKEAICRPIDFPCSCDQEIKEVRLLKEYSNLCLVVFARLGEKPQEQTEHPLCQQFLERNRIVVNAKLLQRERNLLCREVDCRLVVKVHQSYLPQ